MALSRARFFSLLGFILLYLSFELGASARASSPAAQAHSSSDADTVPGAAEYSRAQSILSSLDAPTSRGIRLPRSNNFFGTVWTYLRKGAVFLFINDPQASGRSVRNLSPLLEEAAGLLESASGLNHTDARYALANLSFYGTSGYPRNYTRAFMLYSQLAESLGHSGSQYMLGFIFATGVGDALWRDQSKALLYHTFAADAGDTRSQMTLAFRHHAGIGAPRDCEKSVQYYKKVADKAIHYVQTGPPGGRRLRKDLYSLADDKGGIYGDGASYNTAGVYARHGPAPDSDQTMEDYLEYLDLMSRKGDLKATFRLGQYYFDGSRALKQNFGAARDFFQDISRRYWSTKDGRIKPDVDRDLEKLASKSAGYLGSMFLRGEGVEQNADKARIWFRRGVENGDSLCQYYLGLMHLLGIGVAQDAVKASEFFGAAADQDLAVAQVRLGALHLDQGDVQSANKYFDLAARHHNIESIYYLAELTNFGVGRDRSCSTAALYYKLVAERAEALHSSFSDANHFYETGDEDAALVLYLQAAEQGYEQAQANVAYILDGKARVYSTILHSIFPSIFGFASSQISEAALALTHWTRSAKQANVDSLVKMGDYYLAGLGVPRLGNDSSPAAAKASVGPSDPDKAATCYSAAAETQMSAQALWNLGWMHENGMGGMSRDFHLAKRYYDSALETNPEAYLPVTLALLRLRLRSWWNGVIGGKAKGINSEDTIRRRSFTEWLSEFLIAEMGEVEQQQAHHPQAGGIDAEGNEWDNGYAPDDTMYDDYDLAGESLWEAALFAGLAAGLALLVWFRQTVRQRQQDRPQDVVAEDHRAQGNGRVIQQHRQDRGLFPAQNDPEFADWAVGGVGH